MKIEFIGWCNDPIDNHDKVWGLVMSADGHGRSMNSYATFWGRRGKKLQTKQFNAWSWEVTKLIDSKLKKGYVQVPEDKVNDVYDRFAKDLFKIALKV